MKISEHSREGSDWVDDIKGHQHHPSGAVDDIQGHPRGRVGRAWRIRQEVVLRVELDQKAKEFLEQGAEVYAKF